MLTYNESKIYIIRINFAKDELLIRYLDYNNEKELVLPYNRVKIKFFDSVKGGLFSPSFEIQDSKFKIRQYSIGIYSGELVDNLYNELVKRVNRNKK